MAVETKVEDRLSNEAKHLLKDRYLWRNERGKIVETPAEMFRRVAREVNLAEIRHGSGDMEDEFFEMMTELRFLPNSPTLMNAGGDLGQLSACFVLPIQDSMEKIFETAKKAALVQKSGGGVGYDFTPIRAKGEAVRTTAGVASGPMPFIEVFEQTAQTVKQGGKRRGANMAVLRIDHPNIEEFIKYKQGEGGVEAFNFSVGITDKFMKAVIVEESFELIHPNTGQIADTVSAPALFHKIAKCSWNNGEPGILFIDQINREHCLDEEITATNPCGEVPLLPYEACNLGSVNVAAHTKWGDKPENVAVEMASTIRTATRFLDDVIDVNNYPMDEIEKATLATRKTGLGLMGVHDALIKMDIPYGAPEAQDALGKIMMQVADVSKDVSQKLVEERQPFPKWSESDFEEERRNATTTCVAPTGSISCIAGVSASIEPLFALSEQQRMGNVNTGEDEYITVVHDTAMEYLERNGLEEFRDEVMETGGLPPEVSNKHLAVLRTAMDVPPLQHIKMMAAAQRHTENAVSKTINMPHSATINNVKSVMAGAWGMGCKGFTVYRNGSRKKEGKKVGCDENGCEI